MAMDGGVAGLEQSDHHPLAGRSQYSPPSQTQASDSPASIQGGAGDLAASLIQHIEACVIPGKKDEVSRLLHELRYANSTRRRRRRRRRQAPRRPRRRLEPPFLTTTQLLSASSKPFCRKPSRSQLRRPPSALPTRQWRVNMLPPPLETSRLFQNAGLGNY
jgi:hypothetical protein